MTLSSFGYQALYSRSDRLEKVRDRTEGIKFGKKLKHKRIFVDRHNSNAAIESNDHLEDRSR